jgi:hypothetical protein
LTALAGFYARLCRFRQRHSVLSERPRPRPASFFDHNDISRLPKAIEANYRPCYPSAESSTLFPRFCGLGCQVTYVFHGMKVV